ncbi:hypothetical protein A9K55_000272 [Cordyceps militaris]|uniref:Uncharacterized protein n=1 Tax=Cordyceps militaris TaxID=73501 RepID=A0A2H4SVP2_CORMI|nr:hypothetical protein A9K55_000272 [Cordyceps militaris]
MRQFCQAILDMVEVGDLREIESLADRLRPYRVETYNTAASKLKLVLEDDLPNRNLASARLVSPLPNPPRACLDGFLDKATGGNAAAAQTDNGWSEWLLTPTSLLSPTTEDYRLTDSDISSLLSGDDADMYGFSLNGSAATGLGINLGDDSIDPSVLSLTTNPTMSVHGSSTPPPSSHASRATRSAPFIGLSASPRSLLHPAEVERYIRSDCASYLQNNAERWLKNGLWYQTEFPNPKGADPSCEGLRFVYSCICRLEMRIEDDAIRNRMAIIVLHEWYDRNVQEAAAAYQRTGQTSRGRGYVSVLVDKILAQVHGHDWETASLRRRKELRAKFHDRKRYGKRWWTLSRAAGQGILFLCTQQLVAIVKNTRVSCENLRILGEMLSHAHTDTAKVLQAFNRTAESLIQGGHGVDHDNDLHPQVENIA